MKISCVAVVLLCHVLTLRACVADAIYGRQMPLGAYGALDEIEPWSMHSEMSEKEKAYGTEAICEEDDKEIYGSKSLSEWASIVGFVFRVCFPMVW